MKQIPLSQQSKKLAGKYFVMVDDEDYEYLNQFSWSLDRGKKTFYARGWANGINIRMHRLIMKAADGQLVDHRDLNGLNNQKDNLRFCNYQQNAMNRRAWGTSKYLGVYKKYVRKIMWWFAVVKIDGENFVVGRFKDEKEAALARDKKANEVQGEFACLNFPDAINKRIEELKNS